VSPSLTFNFRDGSATISTSRVHICRGLSRQDAVAALSSHFRSALDHGNGCEWLSFQGVTFGSQPCGLALLFRHGTLTEIHFSVMLTGAKMESGWPTRAAIDAELAFVRQELSTQLKATVGEREAKFSWGVAWSAFDPKGFQASSGIRYAA
jgi:hypothetical protein